MAKLSPYETGELTDSIFFTLLVLTEPIHGYLIMQKVAEITDNKIKNPRNFLKCQPFALYLSNFLMSLLFVKANVGITLYLLITSTTYKLLSHIK